MINPWNQETLLTRISDIHQRQRFSGGSPNEVEIATYTQALPPREKQQIALILGMTPELRRLAAQYYDSIISVDMNSQAIELYRDWLEETERAREQIIHCDWFKISTVVKTPIDVIMGDGVFGNLPDVVAHRQLLQVIAASLKPKGYFITRHALIPNDFDPAAHRAEVLLQRYRHGEIDEAEFGFGMRLVGHYESCYDQNTYLLDNAKIFEKCQTAYQAEKITATEHSFIRRYYFGGKNCILPQDIWEQLLIAAGFKFVIHSCQGKEWYRYYIIYQCQLN